ncbi:MULTISPECIES: 2OG-Fe(II) oxygenase [Streptomyces]|uniref:2OG-Fe(II) oxygenase n=1 Tax=Streptomyces TaxID=1883 RepID=UPI002018DB48|nr:2OG-Fe(II) oxygenase [Streptomyces fradiae]UQS32122.1 2OG-Fe(II) oxygenase [Streptomyces fradiae]
MTWKSRLPLVVESAIPLSLCGALTDHVKNHTARPRTYQGVIDESLRKSEYVEIPTHLQEAVISHCAAHVRSHFEIAPKGIPSQPAVVYRYGPGVGFVAHHDEVTEIERERARTNGQPVVGGDLTLVVWLNTPDSYGGGELFFESPAQEIKPPCGTLVAFPATRDRIHGVRPVTRGERVTLVVRVDAECR